MKSGFVKRLLSIVLAVALFSGHVMPVMAEGDVTVSENVVADTEVAEDNQTEESSEDIAIQDVVTAGVAQDIVVNDPVQETVVEEPVSETEISTEDTTEEVAEEIVESTEEVVEETTEEVVETEEESVSENENSEETTEEADESLSMNEIPEEEVALEDTFLVSLEPVTVNGITITVSGPASAFADGTTVSAVEVEPAEVVIEAAEEEEEAVVKRYKAFDINLVCDGEFVQPLNGQEITVNFEGDLLIPDTEKEEVVVYHVDDNDEITKMEAEVVATGVEFKAVEEEAISAETEDEVEVEVQAEVVETVEMTTTHFSTYVVIITGGSGKVNFTVNHYLNDGWKSYTDSKSRGGFGFDKEKYYLFESDAGAVDRDEGRISDFTKGKNIFGDTVYEVAHIDIVGGKTDKIERTEDSYEYTVTSDDSEDIIINVFYSETPNDDLFINEIDLYDYNGNLNYNDTNSINYYKNYKNYNRYNDQSKAQRFATRGSGYNEATAVSEEGNTVLINAYNDKDKTQIIKGLLTHLSGPNYETVNFKFDDPGFFTPTMKTANGETIKGKTIHDDYSMVFSKAGIKYTLSEVRKGQNVVINKRNNGKWYKADGKLTANNYADDKGKGGFWPLESRNDKNEYFGLRHNFKFVIGDYVGNMNYKFTGDDDLWVCLNGTVILDLGGIHDAVDGEVDIWAKLIGKENYTYNDKVAYLNRDDNGNGILNRDEEMYVSVLYMERGGNLSNCEMEFVMPNIEASEPHATSEPKANLEITKIDSTNEDKVIPGVSFGLYWDSACTESVKYVLPTDSNGKVIISSLRRGTYYLKETEAADGYSKSEKVYKVIVDGDNAKITIDGIELSKKNDENTYLFVVENTPLTTILEIYKKELYTNDPIFNVKFELYEGNKIDNSKLVGTLVTSGQDAVVKFEDITVGEYYLVEKLNSDQLEKYKRPQKGWKITVAVSKDKTSLEYEITDGPKVGSTTNQEDSWTLATGKDGYIIMNEPYVEVEFTKVNALTEEAMADVEFKLYEGNSDVAEKLEATVTSDTNGKVKFEQLTEGQDYLLVETTPEGFIEETPWIVRVDFENNQFVQKIFKTRSDESSAWVIDGNAYAEAVIENTPARGPLTIAKTVDKVDAVHGIAAFMFKIDCPDGSTLYRTISFTEAGTKSVTIEDLPLGKYTVEEVEPILRYTKDNVNLTGAQELTVDGLRFEFSNKKVFSNYFSHSDVKVNKVTFTREDGQVIAGLQESESSDNVVEENN